MTTIKKGRPPLEEIETESAVFGSYGRADKLPEREPSQGFDTGYAIYTVGLIVLAYLLFILYIAMG